MSLRIPAIDDKFYTEYEKQCDKIAMQRKTIIENILVTLELGGSKADLDKMLAEI